MARLDRCRAIADDPIARQFLPDSARTRCQRRTNARTRSATRRTAPARASSIAIPIAMLLKLSARLRGLLPVLLSPRDGRAGAAERTVRATALATALAYIAERPAIWEVILTGGDPLRRLTAPARRLSRSEARRHRHIRASSASTRACLSSIAGPRDAGPDRRAPKASGKTIYVAIHANHPRELTPRGPGRLRDAFRMRASAS